MGAAPNMVNGGIVKGYILKIEDCSFLVITFIYYLILIFEDLFFYCAKLKLGDDIILTGGI